MHLGGHALLCTGAIPDEIAEEHPLIIFKQHAVTSNEIFLLVADLFAKACQVFDRESTRKEDAVVSSLSVYDEFVRHCWWEVAISPVANQQEHLNETLHRLVVDSWPLLDEAIGISRRGLQGILSEEYMARCVVHLDKYNG